MASWPWPPLLRLAAGTASLVAASDPVVGQVDTFWVKDWNGGGYLQVEAEVAQVGDSCVVYVQNGEFVAPVTVERLRTEFDAAVYPRVTELFGAEPRPGIDDQSRIVILLYDFATISVNGYFSPLDIAPAAGQGYSNRREMIYLNGEVVASEPENAGSLAAHEFAHLIVYYRDYLLEESPGRTEEPTWMYEGFSTFAEHVAGYDGRTNSQLRSFANDPGTNLTSWADYRAHYGASYAFMSYLAMRQGEEFVTDLVNQPADGVAGINETLLDRGETFETFDTLLDDWMVANFLDGRDPEVYPYSYPDLEIEAASVPVTGSFPLTGSELAVNFGAVYLDFPAVDSGSTLLVAVDGDSTAPLRAALISWDSNGILPPTVTRLQLVSGDGDGTAPPGYDRHTLAVWARGTVGKDALYAFRYTASVRIPGAPEFIDLGPEDPYYPYVAELYIRNVISGKEVPEGSGLWYFLGGENVLRAQFAKMIMESIGLHTPAIDHLDDPTFTDVPLTYEAGVPQPYPYDYVEEAAALGIVRGYDDGLFRPYSPITRGQLVLMITRGANAAGRPLPQYTGVCSGLRRRARLAPALSGHHDGLLGRDTQRQPRQGRAPLFLSLFVRQPQSRGQDDGQSHRSSGGRRDRRLTGCPARRLETAGPSWRPGEAPSGARGDSAGNLWLRFIVYHKNEHGQAPPLRRASSGIDHGFPGRGESGPSR